MSGSRLRTCLEVQRTRVRQNLSHVSRKVLPVRLRSGRKNLDDATWAPQPRPLRDYIISLDTFAYERYNVFKRGVMQLYETKLCTVKITNNNNNSKINVA